VEPLGLAHPRPRIYTRICNRPADTFTERPILDIVAST
jgi:hypothetical protein